MGGDGCLLNVGKQATLEFIGGVILLLRNTKVVSKTIEDNMDKWLDDKEKIDNWQKKISAEQIHITMMAWA